jgi:integrase
MTEGDIKKYMSHIRKEYSDSYYNVIGSAVKILFEKVLKQPRKMMWFSPIRTTKKFHNIISYSDFVLMGKSCKNSKHKLILVLLYSTGIRRQELIDIKLKDIDFVNKRIFIHSAKGGKNRFVRLHDIAEKYLLKYLKEYHPSEYLLNGQKSLKYSGSSVFNVIKDISDNRYHPHDIRHTFLTNLIEHENVFAAQDYAGHNCLKSTLHYYHISSDKLREMYNPLDKMISSKRIA